MRNNIKLQPLKCSFLAINTEERDSIILTNGIIKHKNESIYLGSIFSSKGSVKSDVILEIQKRQKHFNKFYAFLRENYNAPLLVKERVLEACVSSAVLYNCESWGDANIDCLEILYRKALKYMLGVRTQVCNEFPYIELGKPTLNSIVQKRQYIFYKKCVSDNDWPLQRYIIRKAMDVNCSFITYYTTLANNYTSANEIIEKSLKNLADEVELKANRGKTRYETYIQINPTLSRPTVYDTTTQTYKLHNVTRLRMISHNLKIEIGRHKRPPTPREERLCTCGEIETEKHYLTSCNIYTHIREKYKIKNDHMLHIILDNNSTANYVTDLNNCKEIINR